MASASSSPKLSVDDWAKVINLNTELSSFFLSMCKEEELKTMQDVKSLNSTNKEFYEEIIRKYFKKAGHYLAIKNALTGYFQNGDQKMKENGKDIEKSKEMNQTKIAEEEKKETKKKTPGPLSLADVYLRQSEQLVMSLKDTVKKFNVIMNKYTSGSTLIVNDETSVYSILFILKFVWVDIVESLKKIIECHFRHMLSNENQTNEIINKLLDIRKDNFPFKFEDANSIPPSATMIRNAFAHHQYNYYPNTMFLYNIVPEGKNVNMYISCDPKLLCKSLVNTIFAFAQHVLKNGDNVLAAIEATITEMKKTNDGKKK